MSGATMAALKNGSQVPLDTLLATCKAAETLVESEQLYVLSALIKKCQDSSYKLRSTQLGDPMTILKQYHLIDGNGTVPEDVIKIILNATTVNGSLLTLSIPTDGDVIDVTFTKKW